jgi:hypothetical protein
MTNVRIPATIFAKDARLAVNAAEKTVRDEGIWSENDATEIAVAALGAAILAAVVHGVNLAQRFDVVAAQKSCLRG